MREISGAVRCALGVGVALVSVAVWSPAPAGAVNEATCASRPVTISGTGGDDVIQGTSGDDVIAARGGADVIRAGAGKDVVCGGAGDDVVSGGRGSDLVLTEAGDDIGFGGDGRDGLLGGGGNDRVRGGRGGDFFDSDPGNDSFVGGPGADLVAQAAGTRGQSGRDRILTGDGADVVEIAATDGIVIDAGADDDTVTITAATAAALSLVGGDGIEDQLVLRVTGDSSAVRLDQRAGRLITPTGHQVLTGWELASLEGDVRWTYVGTDAEESLLVYGGTLNADMGAGGDNVYASGTVGNSYVDLGPGDIQTAQTGGGDDVLIGGDGIDHLFAGNGDNVLLGGLSTSDWLEAGDGFDVARDPDGAAICRGLDVVPDNCEN
ncbi:MAG TPA: hypothetical protein VNS55_08510 [Nocardioides sp.]|nr:hypothetical protein [Nocardioides sp.]